MKRVFACLVIIVVFPMMTSPTQHKSCNGTPFGSVAFAGHSTPTGLAECNCEFGLDGVCPCCEATLLERCVQPTGNHAGHSSKRIARPAAAPGSLSLTARTLLFVIALLPWSGA